VIGVLVVTHGRLGEALVEACGMLVSENECLRSVGFHPGEGVEDLDASVRAVLADMEPNDGVLCLADLAGGSPARVLGGLLLERPQLEVVAGVNLPMLAETLLLRRELDLQGLVQHALASGTQGIVDVGSLLRGEAL